MNMFLFFLLLGLLAGALHGTPLTLRPHAVIRAETEAAAHAIAEEIGATDVGALSIPGHYIAEMHPARPAHPAVVYVTESDVVYTRVQPRPVAPTRSYARSVDYGADWPNLFTNSRAAQATGAGVIIVSPDFGADWTHPDLPTVSGPHSWDVSHPNSTAMPPMQVTHGTSVAAMAVAADNNLCGTGVAPGATLYPVRLLEPGVGLTSTHKAEAMLYAPAGHVAVVSNSWGPNDHIPMVNQLDTVLLATFATLYARNTTLIFASGNGREFQDHMALDGYASNRYTIAVGAVGPDGRAAYYTESGGVAVSAPSSNKEYGVTAAEPGGLCTDEFGGTSAAAPQIAGMVALMASVAPNLTPTDVLDILVRSAALNMRGVSRIEPMNRNAAGLYYSTLVGFGIPDAAIAVEMARNRTARWVARDVSTPLSLPHPLAMYGSTTMDAVVAQNGTVVWAAAVLGMEFGDCSLARVHSVSLMSPSGTIVQVFEPTGTWTVRSVLQLEMPTRAFHGEHSAGKWTVRLTHTCSPSVLVTDMSRVELQIV